MHWDFFAVNKGNLEDVQHSSVYRFKLDDAHYVFVKTRSQKVETHSDGCDTIIFSKHSIIRYVGVIIRSVGMFMVY